MFGINGRCEWALTTPELIHPGDGTLSIKNHPSANGTRANAGAHLVRRGSENGPRRKFEALAAAVYRWEEP